MAGILCNEGETIVGDILCKDGTKPDLYLLLYTDTTQPAETITLATITELAVANGYARIILAHTDWTESPVGTLTNILKTFTCATANWGAVYGYGITTTTSGTAGKMVAVEHFSDGPYTVNVDGIVKVTPALVIA